MDVKKSSRQHLQHKPVKKNSTAHKVWIGSYLFLAAACTGAYFLLRTNEFPLFGSYQGIMQKILLGASLSFVILTVLKIAEHLIKAKTHTRSTRYNLVRVVRLITALCIASIFISILFVNWYTAAVSLGLISLILGFALQTPISSFIGWIYLIIRAPYHVGDRIQMDTFTGDVVEINYLDTTLWEFAGDYLTNDLPSGRLIRFPNSFVFEHQVYNYSWKKFPFIWNEIPFYVAFESDLEYVQTTMRETAIAEMGPDMMEHVKEYKDLIRQTPVDELEIKDYPFICFRINANTWVEALLIYLVHPKEASAIRTRLIKKILAALLKEPARVMFPNGNAR
jgi:small-conductance mechanosensitive channel